MRILFVCHRLPYPPNRGGKIRPFNMIRHLGHKHSVVVASLAQTEDELEEGSCLKDYCEDVIAEVVPHSRRWLQAFAALPTTTPSSVAYFWSPRLYRRIRERVLDRQFDAVFVHCVFVAQYVMDLHSNFRIMDFGDLDSGKWAEYSQWKSFPFSRLYAFESEKLRAYEKAVAGFFDRCSVTTQGEQLDYDNLQVPTRCTLIPNGVDMSYFFPHNISTSSSKPTMIFLGRMDYFPNIDAVHYFANEVLPLIRDEVPNAEFCIVGSNPTRTIRELARIPGTVVTGHVPDVRPYLGKSAVAVAPLRIARGTQNKILESMAMGIPVVATPMAAKGIQALPGKDLIVADTPSKFAQHVVALLQSSQLRRTFAEAGRRQVENAHQWSAAMSILDSMLAEGPSRAELKPSQ